MPSCGCTLWIVSCPRTLHYITLHYIHLLHLLEYVLHCCPVGLKLWIHAGRWHRLSLPFFQQRAVLIWFLVLVCFFTFNQLELREFEIFPQHYSANFPIFWSTTTTSYNHSVSDHHHHHHQQPTSDPPNAFLNHHPLHLPPH